MKSFQQIDEPYLRGWKKTVGDYFVEVVADFDGYHVFRKYKGKTIKHDVTHTYNVTFNEAVKFANQFCAGKQAFDVWESST